MDKKLLFNNALAALVDFAADMDNKITSEQVKSHFQGLIDDDSQYNFIYDYLSVNKITITDLELSSCQYPTEENDDNAPLNHNMDSEEELSFIKMYMDEIASIAPEGKGEKSELIKKLITGDTSAINRIIEIKLKTVSDIASQYRGQGVSYGDLIQEGNIGLMLGVSDYNESLGDFDTFIEKKIIAAIENTISNQISSDRIGQHLADRLNQLDKFTKELNEKLGRVPDKSELAQAMNMSEEDVSLLLKTSLDTLSVNEDTQITEDGNSGTNITESDNGNDPLQWRNHTRK